MESKFNLTEQQQKCIDKIINNKKPIILTHEIGAGKGVMLDNIREKQKKCRTTDRMKLNKKKNLER